MEQDQKTIQGFVIRRRCDDCGIRTDVAAYDGEKCILKCSRCGKEYNFRFGATCSAG